MNTILNMYVVCIEHVYFAQNDFCDKTTKYACSAYCCMHLSMYIVCIINLHLTTYRVYSMPHHHTYYVTSS